MTDDTFDVFLSHNSKDKPAVRQIAEALRARGLRVCLALLLQATNRLEEAEPLIRRALQVDEDSFGPNHPDVAIDLNNLALLLQETRRLDEAEPLIRRSLEILEPSLGADHPMNLAALLQKIASRTEPEPLE